MTVRQEACRKWQADRQQGVDITRIECIELPLDYAFRVGKEVHSLAASRAGRGIPSLSFSWYSLKNPSLISNVVLGDRPSSSFSNMSISFSPSTNSMGGAPLRRASCLASVIKVAYLARLPGLDRAQKKALKSGTFHGIELVDSVTRLCAMNLLLHGIGEPRHLLAEGRRP